MKVLITGGTGFIGSHVVSELVEENYDVFCFGQLLNRKIKNLEDQTEIKQLICADINESSVVSIIQEINPDYIIHLAAQPSVAVSQQNPLLDVKTNMYGFVNVLEAARRTDCKKFVFATSGGTIYGNVDNEQLPLVEDLPLKACSFYGLTKLTAIHYLDLYKEHFGLDYCALALGNIYGPRQDPHGESGVIAIFTNKIINNEDCTINGDGSVTRDYLYVKDAAAAFVKSLKQGSGLLNLGTGIETSVLEVFNGISSVSGKETRVKFRAAYPGEVQRVSLCIDKIQKQMNWSPQVRFSDGIRLTYEWFLTATKEVQHVR